MKKLLLILLCLPFISYSQTDTTKLSLYGSTSVFSNTTTKLYTEYEIGVRQDWISKGTSWDNIRFGLTYDNFNRIGIKVTTEIEKNFYFTFQPKVSLKVNDEITLGVVGLEYSIKLYKKINCHVSCNIMSTSTDNLYLIGAGIRWN
jgi:hypothetical protein